MPQPAHECSVCGQPARLRRQNYRYTECGLSNVVLQGIEVAACPHCGNEDVLIPRVEKIHRAIAQAIAQSPNRLTGEQLRFLRTHLGFTGDKLGSYLHTDRTKISKWERSEDPIGPATDRLLRLLVAVLDAEIRPAASQVAEHLPLINDDNGAEIDIHINPETLQASFFKASVAA